MSKPSKAFFVSTHHSGWRCGKPLEILGVVFVTPEGQQPRACFHVRDNEDGEEDYAVVSEPHHYELVSAEDVIAGRIPEVVN